MTPERRRRLRAAQIKRMSDLFHAFEWLRMEGLKGNHHAANALRELRRLNHGRTKVSQKPKYE